LHAQSRSHSTLPSFPTRRSSDLADQTNHATYKSSNDKIATVDATGNVHAVSDGEASITATHDGQTATVALKVKNTKDDFRWSFRDRKSTRLNSSHQIISYAVFCL